MRYSLSTISFINIILTAFIFSFTIGVFTIIMTYDSYESRTKELESSYIKKNKILVKSEVDRVVKRISTIENLTYSFLRTTLEEKVNIVDSLFNNSTHDLLTDKQVVALYKKELDLFKWDNGSGYFYIFSADGNVLYHGANEALVGKNYFDLVKGNKELGSFIESTFKKGKNFGSYDWYKPNSEKENLFKKYVYAKKVDKFNLYIAAGIYKSELSKNVQSLVFKELESERFGENNYGYFWVNDLNEQIIMHPIQKELENQILTDFKTLDGQFLFKNTNKLVLEKGSGFVNYRWYRPDNNKEDEKISYVHLVKEWGLVIGSGFYLTELKDILADENRKLEESLFANLKNILLTLAILIILSILSALYVSRRIKIIEESQKEHLNMLEQYKLILDSSVLVSKTSLDGIITYVNDSFTTISGYSKEEVIGQAHSIIRHPNSSKQQFRRLWKTIQNGQIWKGIIKNKNKNGETYFNSTTILPIKDSHGNIVEYISSGADVTELIENRSKIKNIFNTDQLTGLENRVSLIRSISKHSKGVLAIINIDRFKEVNDIKGHELGDKIIQELGLRLFNFTVDKNYTLYRVQADVFAVYALKSSKELLVSKINKFMDSVGKEPYVIDGQNITLTYTAGIASNHENLFTYADMALSEAKNKKIRIKVYDTSMNNIKEYQQNLLWVEKLHVAIAEDRIVPYFQPIYNYHTNKIEKYECLMRLIEDGEVVFPGEYLPVAKKTKLYPELTRKMVTKSIDKFATCTEEFSINLSIEDLMNEDLMQYLCEYIEKKNVFNRVVLEIVESEEIEDSESISKTITKFKEKGAKIAIDDFGSGYSNYEYLISLQADYVKIDGSIVKHVLEDERTAQVVKSIVKFAQKSNMKTIAEFVSSKELDEKIRSLGVDYAQGFYYGKAEDELLK